MADVASLTLYPGTALETRLTDVQVSVTADRITMTTAGGTAIAAGELQPNTTVTLPGRSTSIVRNQ